MYTSYIGKKFLIFFNKSNASNLSAKEFFNTIQFPLFFDDDRHLMHVHGSTFFQKVGKDFNSATHTEHQYRLQRLHTDLDKGVLSGSTYVGYAAGAIDGTSTGQITSISHQPSVEEAYYSWIGQALAVGISGGFVILMDKPELHLLIYEGWKYYRQYLQQTPGLKDKQIETWNGQWLAHTLSNRYSSENPMQGFTPEVGVTLGKQAIQTLDWPKLVFALARKFPKISLICYCYNLSQTNTTLGFINFALPRVMTLFDLRDVLFLDQARTILTDNEILNLEPYYNFKNACARGTIGLSALEPKGLRELMPKGSQNWAGGKDFKFTDKESQITFQLYKLWIMAILNKIELLDLADKTAESLIAFEGTDNRGKKVSATLSQEVRDSKNIREFIANLTDVLEKSPEYGELFKKVVDEVIHLPVDTFPMFVTLVRFQYAFRKSNSNNQKT